VKVQKSQRIRGLVAAAGVAAVVFGTALIAANSTVVVSNLNSNGWAFFQETAVGTGSFVNGPGNPPLGSGSAQLTVNSTGRELLGTQNHAGTNLADITQLEYSTYRQSGDSALAASLQLQIDYDTTDANVAWQGRLVYEPYLTGATVTTGSWQTWDALAPSPGGAWWASGAPGNLVCPQSNPCNFSEVLAAFPNAAIWNDPRGAILFKAGGPWLSGFVGNVDAFTIGINNDNTTYDFEFLQTPANKDDCKKGGWESRFRADGSAFKNQGDCIQYVNTGK